MHKNRNSKKVPSFLIKKKKERAIGNSLINGLRIFRYHCKWFLTMVCKKRKFIL